MNVTYTVPDGATEQQIRDAIEGDVPKYVTVRTWPGIGEDANYSTETTDMQQPNILTYWAQHLVDAANVREEVRWQLENRDEDDPIPLKEPDEYTDEEIAEAQTAVAMRYADHLYQLHDDLEGDIMTYLSQHYPKGK